jgi:hypothetical protein
MFPWMTAVTVIACTALATGLATYLINKLNR